RIITLYHAGQKPITKDQQPLERLKSKYPPLVDEYLNRKLSEYESRLARRAKAINRLKQPVNN
ncbi:MAG: hypothetical protein CL592_06185, partial [Alteromonas sp.]|nr:hypothetical protein [Alteromonas sp.]